MRTEKLRRFVDVQRQLQRAAEWTLHDLRQEEHRLQQAQQDVFSALDRQDEFGFGLAPALTRRLARLSAAAETAAEAGERQVDIVLEHGGRLKHAERLQQAANAEEGRERDKAVLGDLLDVIVGRSRQRTLP